MRWFYAPEYDYGRNLSRHQSVHGFALDKPSRIRRHLITADVVAEGDFTTPEPVAEEEIAAIHTEEVIYDLHDSYAVSRAVEFEAISLLPADTVWEAVVTPQLFAAGGTCEALRAALDGAWGINLSGGFHHARPNLSHGFCLVNDVAMAVARVRREGRRPRLAIVDLDLHQGDGNASFFAKDDEVFTFSLHEQLVYPTEKVASNLDMGLPSGVGDDDYLERVEDGLSQIRERFAPEVVVYVAGSDPFIGDPLGSLRLTPEGMITRDRRVAEFSRDLDAALIVLPAGGYSEESPTLTAAGFSEIAAVEAARA